MLGCDPGQVNAQRGSVSDAFVFTFLRDGPFELFVGVQFRVLVERFPNFARQVSR
jgi:hypothetical protein